MELYITEDTKKRQIKKWTNREYHVQHNKDVDHQDVKIYCATNQFHELQFLGPHNKLHGACGLVKQHNMCFDTKLGHVTCAIPHIPCACTSCISIMDQPWVPSITTQKQRLHRIVQYFTYWLVLGYFKILNFLQLSHMATSSK